MKYTTSPNNGTYMMHVSCFEIATLLPREKNPTNAAADNTKQVIMYDDMSVMARYNY